MRKICCYLLLGLLGAVFYGCNNDQVSSPSQPSFTVDKTSGLIGATQFTFTVNQVSAGSISLFPYGTEDATKGGILLLPSDFTSGQAKVVFTYAFVGTFNAVVVANNHSADGNSVKNVRSATQAITLTSNLNGMSDFSLTDNTDKKNPVTVVGKFTGNNIAVTLPYANGAHINNLVASFTVSPFAVVTIGSTTQVSGTTVNDFTSSVTYTVKSSDGTATQDFIVTTSITPVETDNTLKSAAGKNISTAEKSRALQAYVDNATRNIVVYDNFGVTDFDSVRLAYTTNGSFASGQLKQDSLLNLTSSKTLVITAQDNSTGSYTIHAVAAPNLTLAFNGLTPAVTATTSNFGITADVLTGPTVPPNPFPTYIQTLATSSTITTVAGVSVNSITANGAPFSSGDVLDFTSPVTFVITVTDANLGGITYSVTYKASVNVVK
jgi:hypothetical protein